MRVVVCAEHFFDSRRLCMKPVMFSRGNVNERRRMGTVKAQGETALDLYAGIGYFTIPLLAQADVAFLYACELNPDSVEALRRNLRANGVESRCEVLPGDNAVTALKVKGLVDRVNLGLLPSSELGWGLAMAALKSDSGGWLHVHENVAEADEPAWLERLQVGECGWGGACCDGEEIDMFVSDMVYVSTEMSLHASTSIHQICVHMSQTLSHLYSFSLSQITMSIHMPLSLFNRYCSLSRITMSTHISLPLSHIHSFSHTHITMSIHIK